MSESFSAPERQQLVDRYFDLRRSLSAPHNKAFTIPQRQAMTKERDSVLQEYAERLPFVSLGRCPFCAELLEYPLDAAGLNGPWWFTGPLVEYPNPKACKHFRVLMGAVDFHSNQPLETGLIPEILPGPGAPFVVPRLFDEVPAMKALLYGFTLPPDYPAFVTAYFSEKPVHGAFLHQSWGRKAYQVLNEDGDYEGWSAANDKLDFDLQPWIDKGVLLWINPNDSRFILQNRPPCPYVGLPGVRAPQKIVRGKLETLPLPTGEKLEPFE